MAVPPLATLPEAGVTDDSLDAGREGDVIGRPALYGDTTILSVVEPGSPRHQDGSAPQKTWTLRSKVDPSKTIATGTLDGDYRPVTYALESKVHVLLHFGPMGAWYGIRDIALIDEKGALREKLLSPEFFAVTDVESKDGQRIALVGKMDDTRGASTFRLLMFHVATARVRDVGPAPPAPPRSPACETTGSPSWLDASGIAAYQPIDAGIITFEAGKLVVTKGADTCKARARSRDRIEYDTPSRIPNYKNGGGLL